MGEGSSNAALSLLRVRARACTTDSRELISDAHDHALRQRRYARAALMHAQQQAEETINRWPATHGLAATRRGQTHEYALGLILGTAQALFNGCGSVSLTTVDQLDGRRPYRTAASTGIAEALDAAQYRLGQGPCIEALELDMVADVRAGDLTADRESDSWPRFCRVAVALGIRSSLSISLPWTAFRVGLHAEQRPLASINFYAGEPHAFVQTEHHARMLGCWAGSIATGKEPAEIHRASF